jgi:hypothetical protein
MFITNLVRRTYPPRAMLVGATLTAALLTNGCTGPAKDFDIVTITSDANGLPRNPKWGQQAEHNTIPDPYKSCPIEDDSDNVDLWTKSPQYPHCTSFPITFNGGFWCGPHVNFEPITYEGTVFWDHHAFDDDYDLNVRRDDQALYSTVGGQAHIEFDSDETVDNWDGTGTWWEKFHHDGVDHYTQIAPGQYVFDGDAHAAAMINGSPVIVIGKLNLDTSHRGKTEIHPIYAMFVRLNSSDFRQSSWTFFVRNWGDEGFCSDDDQPFETREHQIKVKIPNVAGLISNNVSQGAQNQDDLSAMQASMQPSGDGVLMTFTLLAPDKQSWFVGDLSFIARPPQVAGSPTPLAAFTTNQSSGQEEVEEERYGPEVRQLQAKIAKLPGEMRRDLDLQLQRLTPRRKHAPTNLSVLFQPAKDEPVRAVLASKTPSHDPSGRAKNALSARFQRKVEFVKKYLSEKGIQ